MASFAFVQTCWNSRVAPKKDMRERHQHRVLDNQSPSSALPANDELPLSVREAATYMGVSVQTVYLWVERKQIPHLRVMGRNIRFLKSDLERFRDSLPTLGRPAESRHSKYSVTKGETHS